MRLGNSSVLKYVLFLVIAMVTYSCIVTELARTPKGTGVSRSIGSVSNGKLENGRRFPFRGENYRYFSRISYAFFNRAWVHSKVLDISLEAYEEMKGSKPNQDFLLMMILN